MKKLKINIISKAEMQKKELDLLKGGCSCRCGCSCQYEGSGGGSSHADNAGANYEQSLHTPGGNCCTAPYPSGNGGYGGNISANYVSHHND